MGSTVSICTLFGIRSSEPHFGQQIFFNGPLQTHSEPANSLRRTVQRLLAFGFFDSSSQNVDSLKLKISISLRRIYNI